MIRFFKKLIQSYKSGVKIGEDIYLHQETKDFFIIDFGKYRIRVCAELLPGNPDRLVRAAKEENRKWLSPYDNELVPDAQYEMIINAVVKYFEKFKKNVKVIWE